MWLFLWPFRTKVSSLPASIPTPPCPTHLGGFRTPNLHRLQRLSLLLGKLAFPRLPPVYRKSLRNNWRLPWCFFPPACFLCRSYSESLGLGCCWGDSQTSLSRWKSVPRNLWVGRKKKPQTPGGKKGQNKNLSHLTILQTGLPRISPIKHILRSKCYLAMKWRSEAFRLSHPSIFIDLARKLWVSKNYQLLRSLFLFSRQHLSLWLRPVWILSINKPPASLMYGKAGAPPYWTELRDWSSWVTELTQYRLTSCLQARGTALTGPSKPLEGQGLAKDFDQGISNALTRRCLCLKDQEDQESLLQQFGEME